MIRNRNLKISRAAAALALLAVAGAANAEAVDVAAVVVDIAAQNAPIALIGSAVLLVYVGIKAFQWVRRALT